MLFVFVLWVMVRTFVWVVVNLVGGDWLLVVRLIWGFLVGRIGYGCL